MKKLIPVLPLVLFLLLVLPAAAPASTMSLSQLSKAVKALQGKVTRLQSQVKTLQARQLLTGSGAPAASIGKSGDLYLDTATLTLYGPKTLAGWGAPAVLKGSKGDPGAQGIQGPIGATGPQGPAGPDPAGNPAYAGLFAIAPYVSVTQGNLDGVKGPNVLFTGANVHIRSGSGSTADFEGLTGLGNLIIGYDENLTGATPRTGSHNLVIGVNNGFASYGGAVFGRSNDIEGVCATVTGGRFNKASADYASVGGGNGNTASGYCASVSGGQGSTASGEGASVSGGRKNIASATWASVSGGWDNEAAAEGASVSGGQHFLLSVLYAWAAGSPTGAPVIAPCFQSPTN